MNEYYSIVYMYYNFFFHSSVHGHLSCFHVLAIVNSAAKNIGVHVSFRIVVFSGYLPSRGIAVSNGSFIASFLRYWNYRFLNGCLPPQHAQFSQFSSVVQSCPTLCDPMDCSTPGLPVHHQLLEFTKTHVHWVDDAIQPSRPLLSPSPPAFNLSQHQGLFKRVSSLHQVAKVLEFQLQHQSLVLNIPD